MERPDSRGACAAPVALLTRLTRPAPARKEGASLHRPTLDQAFEKRRITVELRCIIEPLREFRRHFNGVRQVDRLVGAQQFGQRRRIEARQGIVTDFRQRRSRLGEGPGELVDGAGPRELLLQRLISRQLVAAINDVSQGPGLAGARARVDANRPPSKSLISPVAHSDGARQGSGGVACRRSALGPTAPTIVMSRAPCASRPCPSRTCRCLSAPRPRLYCRHGIW